MWKLSHIFFWRHICAKIDIEKKYFRTHISFLYRYEKSLSLLIWFHEKKYLPMYFQKLSYVMSHVNIIMIYLWVTYIKIKNGVYKIVLGGSSILNFFTMQWKCQIPIPPDLRMALYFLIRRPLLPYPQSKVCSMLISLVYINLDHIKKSQTIHLKKQFEKHENFDCFSFAICCSSSYSNYYCKFLFNFFDLSLLDSAPN